LALLRSVRHDPKPVRRASLFALLSAAPWVWGACALDLDTATYSGGSAEGGAPADEGAPDSTPQADAAMSDDSGDGGDAALPLPPSPDAYATSVLADQPIVYLRLDDTASPLHDASGHGVVATATNVLFGAPGAVAGNAAIHVDGTSSVIDLGSVGDFTGTAPFSLEVWAAIELTDSTYRMLFVKDFADNAGREEYGVYVHTGQLVFERYVDNGATATGVDLSTLGTPSFIHAVAVYDGSSISLYAQGAEVGRIADARPQPPKASTLFVGTGSPGYNTVKGTLDEVAIYDHALTAPRVAAHFAAASAR
jgi:hypothetical protein